VADLVYIRNPLSLRDRERYQLGAGVTAWDWLQEHYPTGCGAPVRFFVNGIEHEVADLDWPLVEGDVAVVALAPAGLETIIITAVITAVISAAVSIGLSLLFPKAKPPESATPDGPGKANPVYDVRSRQNSARLGEPVPVIYGDVLMTPDLCSQPYRRFHDGRDMYLDMLMCLGQGEFEIHQVLIGESDADGIGNDGADYIVVTPAMHLGEFGHLRDIGTAAGWGIEFYENMWSSQEVGEQRFTNAADESGWYRVGRAGVSIGRYIVVNVEWPRGLFQMPAWGSPVSTSVDFTLFVTEADADGNEVPGTAQAFNQGQTNGSIDPLRMTYVFDCGYEASWRCTMVRNTAQYPSGDEQNEFYWRGLMLDCREPTGTPAYGNTTLLMVRLKAEQVSSTSERLVRVQLTRKLEPMGTGGVLVPTASPADAFIDMYVNQTYGARRPIGEVDWSYIAALRDYWGEYRFNAAYTQRGTVWDALSQACQVVAAAPLPIGKSMSIVQDGVRAVRSMLFSEQNMVRSTFQLSYSFEPTGAPDGIEVEFVDGATWSPAYVRWPLASLAPERVNLFGCSDATHAGEYARLQWQRRQKLRRLVEFSTELEGLIPYPGERVAVAHQLPRWGASGFVVGVEPDGLTILVDRDLPWSDLLGADAWMMFRDQDSGASVMVRADPLPAGDNWALLLADPWASGGAWHLGERQEGTHWTFGAADRVVKDFTLTNLAHKGGVTVGISGLVYDPAVYESTLTFLAAPVP
jgi:hypothetical protein